MNGWEGGKDMQISSRFTLAIHIFACMDVFRAVECTPNGKLFHFHENPSANCPVGRNIHHIPDEKLVRAQEAVDGGFDVTAIVRGENQSAAPDSEGGGILK